MENNKKNINNEEKKIINAKAKKEEEIRDTTGDTKIFQVIRKEDIEREKRRQAIEKENQGKDKHIIQDKKTENGNILSKNTEKDDGIIVKKKGEKQSSSRGK